MEPIDKIFIASIGNELKKYKSFRQMALKVDVLSYQHFHLVYRGNRRIDEQTRRAIALAFGYKDYEEFLDVGRQILGFEMVRDRGEEMTTNKIVAKTKNGEPLGDYLFDAMHEAGWYPEELGGIIGDEKRAAAILSSITYPTYTELEYLYLKTGINPVFIFSGDTNRSIDPLDPIGRILRLSNCSPEDYIQLAHLLGVWPDPNHEVKSYLKEWREAKRARKKIHQNIPVYWLSHFSKTYNVSFMYIAEGLYPIIPVTSFNQNITENKREEGGNQKKIPTRENLLDENRELRITIEKLKERLSGFKEVEDVISSTKDDASGV